MRNSHEAGPADLPDLKNQFDHCFSWHCAHMLQFEFIQMNTLLTWAHVILQYKNTEGYKTGGFGSRGPAAG